MNSRAFRRSAVAVAAFSASAIVLAGCAGGAGDAPSADSDEPITLTLATFNDFGYDDELLQEYMDENPNIKIVHNKAADLAGRPHELLREARQGRPRRHRGRRGRLVHRGDAVLRPARRGARQRQGPLARLEGSRRDRRRRPSRRLRHRHRPAGASATAPTCSRPPACRPTPTRSPRCSTATGTTTSTSPTSTRQPPASR